MSCSTCAREILGSISMTISAPFGYNGSVWNDNETAFVTVTVRNTTGSILRDVVIKLHTNGQAKIFPLELWGIRLYGGTLALEELDVGKSKEFTVRLKATGHGQVHMWTSICAEVIPYACNSHVVHRSDEITAN